MYNPGSNTINGDDIIKQNNGENMTENGIVKIKVNGIEYIFWTHAKVVRRYIREDLKNRFPNKIVAREINSIDFTIPELNLPVEVQATVISGHMAGISSDIVE